jgi:hypothetical protein
MSYHERRPAASRPESQNSSSYTSRAPMTIPHNRPAEAPPPLPPPRFIEDLENGHDLGWRWGNLAAHEGFGKLAPIKQSSSLNGGYRWTPTDTSRGDEATEEMDVDSYFDRRGSTVSTIRSPSHPEVLPGSLGYIQSGGKRTPSPSALSNQRLAHSPIFESHVIFLSFTLSPYHAVLRHRARRCGFAAHRHDFWSFLSYAQPSQHAHRMLTFCLTSDYRVRYLWPKRTSVDHRMHMTSTSCPRLEKATRHLDKRAWVQQTIQQPLKDCPSILPIAMISNAYR